MAFVDGEPIDASKLSGLETKLNELEAKIPQIGVANNTINLSNASSSTQTISIPKILAKSRVASIDLKTGQQNKTTITFPESFSKTPTVIVTLEQGEPYAVAEKWTPAPVVTAVSASSFNVCVPLPKSGTVAHKVYVSYIAIAY